MVPSVKIIMSWYCKPGAYWWMSSRPCKNSRHLVLFNLYFFHSPLIHISCIKPEKQFSIFSDSPLVTLSVLNLLTYISQDSPLNMAFWHCVDIDKLFLLYFRKGLYLTLMRLQYEVHQNQGQGLPHLSPGLGLALCQHPVQGQEAPGDAIRDQGL